MWCYYSGVAEDSSLQRRDVTPFLICDPKNESNTTFRKSECICHLTTRKHPTRLLSLSWCVCVRPKSLISAASWSVATVQIICPARNKIFLVAETKARRADKFWVNEWADRECCRCHVPEPVTYNTSFVSSAASKSNTVTIKRRPFAKWNVIHCLPNGLVNMEILRIGCPNIQPLWRYSTLQYLSNFTNMLITS
jgi:hypothetical protein